MIDLRQWRPEHESEGRRIALWACRPVSLASRCPESDQPRFANPDRLYQREHRSNPQKSALPCRRSVRLTATERIVSVEGPLQHALDLHRRPCSALDGLDATLVQCRSNFV